MIDSLSSVVGLRYSSVLSDFSVFEKHFLVRAAFLECRCLACCLIMTIDNIGMNWWIFDFLQSLLFMACRPSSLRTAKR